MRINPGWRAGWLDGSHFVRKKHLGFLLHCNAIIRYTKENTAKFCSLSAFNKSQMDLLLFNGINSILLEHDFLVFISFTSSYEAEYKLLTFLFILVWQQLAFENCDKFVSSDVLSSLIPTQ